MPKRKDGDSLSTAPAAKKAKARLDEMSEPERKFENAKRALAMAIKRGTEKLEKSAQYSAGNEQLRQALKEQMIRGCHSKRST